MIEYLYAQNGKYVRALTGTTEQNLADTPEGCGTTMLPPPRTTDYWNGTEWVAIGSAPAYYMQFDYDIKDWVDTRDLELVKTEKWEAIKLARNQQEFGGFTYKGSVYDSDFISQSRIMAVMITGQPTAWTLANTEVVQLTAEEVKELFMTLAMHIQSVHERGRLALEAIKIAQSNAEVESVLF